MSVIVYIYIVFCYNSTILN